MEQKVLDVIKDAEMILVGIGEEFSPVWKKPEVQIGQEVSAQEEARRFYNECLESRFYESIPKEHEVIAAYNDLRELIGAKPYFVVTMNTDDLIYRSALEQDLIVAPCGSMGKLQCGEHIIPAGEIRDAVLEAVDRLRKRESDVEENAGSAVKQGNRAAENAGSTVKQGNRAAENTGNTATQDSSAENKWDSAAEGGIDEVAMNVSRLAVCPKCGRPLQFHTVAHPGYMEEGYLPQWGKYTKWLQCTLNRRLCILELGVGFKYPQVVRFPFEKTAFFNQKATLIRINSKFPQMAGELAERGISVRENPVVFLRKA